MRKFTLLLIVLMAGALVAQVYNPYPGKLVPGAGGGSGATSLDGLSDVAVGSSPPGTCTDDSLYLDTSEATPADRLKICDSNVWYKVAELTAGDYIDVTGRTISLSTSVPLFSTSTSDGSGACTAGREWHLNTSSGALWWCQSSGTWKAIMISGTANEITLTGSTLSLASTFDISGKTSTKSVKTGTAAPGTCGVGELFYDTDATAGQNLFGCTAADTWTQLGGSGSGAATVLAGGVIASGMAQSATRYHSLGADTVDTTQANRQDPLPRAGTMTALYVSLIAAVGGTAQTITVTVQLDGSDTALSCVISTGATTCNDTGSVAVTAGQLLGVKFVTTGTTGTLYPHWTISFE